MFYNTPSLPEELRFLIETMERSPFPMHATVLSSHGLQRAATINGSEFEFIDNDFEFIGNTCHLRSTRVQAVFISPRVHWLLQQDKTLTSFYLEWKSREMNEKRVFEFLEAAMNGKPIDALASEIEDLCEVATALGNTELLDSFIRDENPLDRLTVCDRLTRNSVLGRSVDEEIEFAASHFSEIDPEDLKRIDVPLLELIVRSDGLRLESEDSLLIFILNLGLEDQLVLVRYLRSEYLSAKGMDLLLNSLGDSIFDPLVWDCLCHRLVTRVVRTFEKENAAKSLDGIISYLTKKHGGNVHEKGIVAVTSKSVWNDDPQFAVTNLVDLASHSAFSSKDRSGQWVCWDFREMLIRPTQYTIRAARLQSWVLEGSLNGRSWTQIDRQMNNRDFESGWTKASFAVSKPAAFRFIRLTQADSNHSGADELLLFGVEFFGTLSE
jgi:hypothetical protein